MIGGVDFFNWCDISLHHLLCEIVIRRWSGVQSYPIGQKSKLLLALRTGDKIKTQKKNPILCLIVMKRNEC